MTYKTKDIVTPIVEFIKTCPFANDFNLDVESLSFQKLDNTEVGSALDYLGSSPADTERDIIGNSKNRRQANFNLWLLRESDESFYREETVNFLYNFEHWIDYCQANGLTPKLTDSKRSQAQEVMFADNASLRFDLETGRSSMYLIQLHIIYTVEN